MVPIVASFSMGRAGGVLIGDLRFDAVALLEGDPVLLLSAWTAEARDRFLALKPLNPVINDGVLWSEAGGPPTVEELGARALHLAALAAALSRGRSALNPRLVERFRGEAHPGVRARLLEAIFSLRPKHEPKEEVAREALRDADARVRRLARAWLLEQGLLTEDEAPTMAPVERVARPTAAAPASAGSAAALVQRLNEPGPVDAVAHALVRVVADPTAHPDDRTIAARALVAKGRPEVGLAAIRSAESWVPALYVASLRALVAYNPQGLARAATRAADPDGRAWLLTQSVDGRMVAHELALALAIVPPSEAGEAALCALIGADDASVAQAAIRALGAVGTAASLDPLQQLLTEDAPAWRKRETADATRAIRARTVGGPSLDGAPNRRVGPRKTL